MKDLLGLKTSTVFLFMTLIAQVAAAEPTKICVDVVEHLPKPEGTRGTHPQKKEPLKIKEKQDSEDRDVESAEEPRQVNATGEGDSVASSDGKVSGETSAVPDFEDRVTYAPKWDDGVKEGGQAEKTPASRSHSTRTIAGPSVATFPVEPPLDWTEREENTNIPLGQSALKYLERLLEHFVTHEVGYVAVEESCGETLSVELYPLKKGWTAFSRYSGTGREERVDQLFPSELSMFAERVVLALLKDVPISATINRENVLKSDSMKSVQRVKGRSHFVLSVGAQFRMGKLPTWNQSVSDSGIESDLRPLFPVKFSLGYRGRFESWGIEAIANLGLGTNTQVGKNSPDSKINLNRGHVDYGGDTGVALHFLRYFDPRGLTSFYLGSGATFEMLWFRVIEANGADKSTLFSGGLNVDGVFGWEFMRASAVQFLLQGELNVPVYFIRSANDEANLETWLPGFTIKIGVVF